MRTKRAFYNLIGNLSLQLINVFVGLILVKLFIETYGSAINGLITSIKQLIAYLNLVEAGVAAASIAALYAPLAAKDKNSINTILSATNHFYRRSGYIFVLLVLCLSILFPFIVQNEVDVLLTFLMVLVLGASGVFEYFFIGKYRVLLTADQSSYILTYIQAIATMVSTISCIILIKLDYNILIVQTVGTLIIIFRIVLIKRYINKKYPTLKLNVQPDYLAISQRWDALIHQIAGLVVFNSPFIIITIFLSLKHVSVYAVYNMVFSGITMLIASFSSGLLAGFGEVLAKGDRDVLLKGYNSFEYIFYIVMTWAYTCTAILIIPFIELYTKEVTDINYADTTIAMLFIIVGAANNIRIPSNTLVNAAGHFKKTKNRAILEAIINLTMSLIFVYFFGLIGVLLGGICSYLYRTIDFIYYASKNILNITPMRTFRKLLRNFLLSILAILPFVSFISLDISDTFSWFLWAIVVAIWTFFVTFLGNMILEPRTMHDVLIRIKILLYK